MRRRSLFSDSKQKTALLNNMYNDYVVKNMTMAEIADKYGYSKRQIRYIIRTYLCVKKGSGKRKMNIEKLDNNEFVVDGKFARKTTLEDLILKAEMVKRKKNKESTNKKVEKNKETN